MASFDHYTIVNPDDLAQKMHNIKADYFIDLEETYAKMESVLFEAMEKLGYGSAIDVFKSVL